MKIPQKSISLIDIQRFIEDRGTKRINFSSEYHKNALRRTGEKEVGKITLPFEESINPVLEEITGCILFKSQFDNKFYRIINDENEYLKIEGFVSKYRNIVFLRDNLDLSLALSMNFDENNNHTEIGELEIQAKFNKNNGAEKELIKRCKEEINELPFYKDADHICAMPNSNSEEESLPKRIVDSLTDFGFKDISGDVFWTSKTRSIKDAKSIKQKLEILEESGFTMTGDFNLKGKTIILFDDLYMS